MTMRSVWMLATTGALAACGPADGGDARPAPPAARTTPAAAARDTGGFEFVLHETEAGVVDSVLVTRAGRPVQTLVPSERLVAPYASDDRTHRVDLDFDGHVDFGLVTLVPAGPNLRYDYWRFDPAAGRFRYVGNYNWVEPDSATRSLHVHTRDGHAGRLWTNERYKWIDGRLVEVSATQQTFLEDIQRYATVIYERRGDSLVVVSVDTLEESEVEPTGDP
jgi:hypothetical protein